MLLNAGFVPALLAFFLWRYVFCITLLNYYSLSRQPIYLSRFCCCWEVNHKNQKANDAPPHSLPGAIGMYALSLGVQSIDDVLPEPVYALLSGLNSAIVGIIALAAIQLAERSIIDRLTRILVIFGACAGLCYNALWYFPLLMSVGGLAAVVWDGWMSQRIGKAMASLRLRRRRNDPEVLAGDVGSTDIVPVGEQVQTQQGIQRRGPLEVPTNSDPSAEILPQSPSDVEAGRHIIHVRVGIVIIILFFGTNSFCKASLFLGK